jgi:copper(I)-binding protein
MTGTNPAMHGGLASGVHHAPELHELTFNNKVNNMQELNFEEIEVVSGGNMPESSVGGSSGWN